AGKQGLTRALVVVQYTISIGLMAATLVMSQQLTYLVNRDLGFDDELVMVVESRQISRAEAPLVLNRMKEMLLPYDEITHVARTGSSFNRGSDRNTWIDENGVTRSAYNFGIGHDYVELMGMELVGGRNFSPDHPSDSTQSVLVNEALVREFGLVDPVGHTLNGWLAWVYDESPVIIGVVRDFNFRSLREKVEPVVLNMHPDYYNYMGAILVKVKGDRVKETIGLVEKAWNAAIPGRPFSYSFLNEDLAMAYANEQRWTDIATWSSVVAILIACLGLFGLATLSMVRRTKEIGIRKVLGASVGGLVELVTREFVLLIAVASILALPIAWLSMQSWLDGFAYRIDVSYLIFVVPPLVTLAIALFAVGYQAFRAATADPMKALRYD
ncbi:MAG TPA: FtsX-like permease family protein, partial [Rhodothermales bacterium]|nr:FtsX-like permease family protein [Rhodothermales bacterium]